MLLCIPLFFFNYCLPVSQNCDISCVLNTSRMHTSEKLCPTCNEYPHFLIIRSMTDCSHNLIGTGSIHGASTVISRWLQLQRPHGGRNKIKFPSLREACMHVWLPHVYVHQTSRTTTKPSRSIQCDAWLKQVNYIYLSSSPCRRRQPRHGCRGLACRRPWLSPPSLNLSTTPVPQRPQLQKQCMWA